MENAFRLRRASILRLHLGGRVDGFFVWVLQAVLDEGVALLAQHVDVELRAARLAEQKAVQERNGDVAIGAALAHDILAGVLLDRAILAVLGPRRRTRTPAEHGKNSSSHHGSV